MNAKLKEPVFESVSKTIISNFVYAALMPLVRILIRYGWSVRDFADVARWVFVKAYYSTPESWQFGRPTALQGAIKTGMPRQLVKKLNEIPEPQQALFTQRQNLAYRVIEGWVRDPEFHVDGKPSTLPLRHQPGPTFNKLVIKYGNDVTLGSVLRDLCDGGCVKVENGIVTLVSQTYGINFLDEEKLAIAGYMLRRHGETMNHNLLHRDLDARLVDRLWQQRAIPADRAAEAMAYMQDALVRYGREIDQGLARFADREPVKDRRYVTVGFGVYAFQDMAEAGRDTAAPRPVKRLRDL